MKLILIFILFLSIKTFAHEGHQKIITTVDLLNATTKSLDIFLRTHPDRFCLGYSVEKTDSEIFIQINFFNQQIFKKDSMKFLCKFDQETENDELICLVQK